MKPRRLALLCSLVAIAVEAAPMNYDQAVAAFRAVKKGQTAAQVTAALGEPAQRDGDSWRWDFTRLPKFPGIHVGAQTFVGGVVQFRHGRVEKSELAWIDATGPAPH